MLLVQCFPSISFGVWYMEVQHQFCDREPICKMNFILLLTLLNQLLNYDIRVILTPLTLSPLWDQCYSSVFLFPPFFSSPICLPVSRSSRPASCLSPTPPWQKQFIRWREDIFKTHSLAVCWIASLQDRVLWSLLPIDLLLCDKLIPFLQTVIDIQIPSALSEIPSLYRTWNLWIQLLHLPDLFDMFYTFFQIICGFVKFATGGVIDTILGYGNQQRGERYVTFVTFKITTTHPTIVVLQVLFFIKSKDR